MVFTAFCSDRSYTADRLLNIKQLARRGYDRHAALYICHYMYCFSAASCSYLSFSFCVFQCCGIFAIVWPMLEMKK